MRGLSSYRPANPDDPDDRVRCFKKLVYLSVDAHLDLKRREIMARNFPETQGQFVRAYFLFRMGDLRGESPVEWDCAALLYRACISIK